MGGHFFRVGFVGLVRAPVEEQRGEEEDWNERHQGEPVEACDAEEDERGHVYEGGEEGQAGPGEQQDREEEKHVVVEVEVGGEQERGCEGGAEGGGEGAGCADEVDGEGQDKDGEEYVEGKGDVGGKEARAADVEKAVEGGHGRGVDGDDGLGAMAFVRGDRGRGDEAQPRHHALRAGDQQAGECDGGGGWKPGEKNAGAARRRKVEEEEEKKAEGDLELEEGQGEEDAGGAVAAGGEGSPEQAGEEKEDDGVLAFGDTHEGGEAEEEEQRARDFGDARVGRWGSGLVTEKEEKQIEDGEGDVGPAVGKECERSVEEGLVGGVVEGDAAPHGADDEVLDGRLQPEVKELGGVVEDQPAGAVEGAEVVQAASERKGGDADGEGDEGEDEPRDDGGEGDAMDRGCARCV